MPYLHLDLPAPIRRGETRTGDRLQAVRRLMETQLWRPKRRLCRTRQDILSPRSRRPRVHHHGPVEFRRGAQHNSGWLGRAIVDACVELLGVPAGRSSVEFTPHVGERCSATEDWFADWTPTRPLRLKAHKKRT